MLHLLCFVLGVHQHVGDYVQVLLGEPFTLCGNCKTAERCKLQRVQLNGIREVAVHQGGIWRPSPGYQSRISENSSVVFIRAVYTDTGVYELTRSGQMVTIHLDVVVGFEASVTEGSALSLPCFYSTTGSTCWSVRWVKDGDVVLEQNSCIDKSTADAADRLSLSADWLPHGDLSLNLQHVRWEDEGNYFCYIQARGGLKQRGNPAAVRLKVSERGADQIVSTAPPPPVSVSNPCEYSLETASRENHTGPSLILLPPLHPRSVHQLQLAGGERQDPADVVGDAQGEQGDDHQQQQDPPEAQVLHKLLPGGPETGQHALSALQVGV
uniref:Ig-like domain-containing protein n=1 Tax=Amphilophus citrinellus TaxID=61819 RepID=A0A3Q0SVC8_AMPCI